MAEKKGRTCIRLTIIKGINDNHLKEYAALLEKGDPDFIEVKAYMHIGESRERLKRENMPIHEEIVAFSKELVKELPEYDIVSEHIPSRVILLAKKKFKKQGKWHTWINFKKFHENNNLKTEDFLLPTPQTGLSGKGTKDLIRERRKEEIELQD